MLLTCNGNRGRSRGGDVEPDFNNMSTYGSHKK
jgi:hypothetical protein